MDSFESQQEFEHTLLEDLCLSQSDTKLILSFLKEQSYSELISKLLLAKHRCLVRVHVLEGFDFAQKDIGSFSDPYLVVKCGKKVFNDRDHY